VIGYLAGYGFADHPASQPFRREGVERETMALAWIGKWFRGQAESAPLLIAVDNLQWADRDSLRMLEHIARQLSDCSGVLIVTARSEFRRQAYMRGLERHTEITLGQLGEAATNTLIQAALGYVSNVPEQMASLIGERAQGNPLFVEEFLRMLFDNGVFGYTENGWNVNTFRYQTLTSTLPTGLLGVLQARLDDLDERTRRVVQIAAVIGHTFWGGCVSQLAQFDARPALQDLIARGLIAQNPESTLEGEQEYTFRHSLYREVAYEILTRPNREAYHQQAGHWLMERVADQPEYFGILADHLALGKQREQALAMFAAAADDRLQRGFLSEALKLTESGLAAAREIAREIALPAVSKLWLLQGQTLVALQRYNEALAASQTALMLLKELPPDDLIEERVTAGYTLGDAYRYLGQYDEAAEALTLAENLLPAGNVVQLAEIVRAFGALARYRGRLDDGQEYHGRALKLAEQLENKLQVAANVLALGLIALDRGELANALGYFKRAMATDRQNNNIYYVVMDLNYIGMVYFAACAYQKALHFFNEAEELQRSIHHRDPLLEANKGLCLIALGEHDAGMTQLVGVATNQYQNAHTRHLVNVLHLAGLVWTGRDAECVDSAAVLIADVCNRSPILHGRGLLWLGLAQQAQGNPAALDTLRQALDNELRYAGRDLWLCYYAVGRASGDSTDAAECYAKAASILREQADSLEIRPEMPATFFNDDFVQTVMALGYASSSP
jgi:tetratricopeptide (TPR) repeat protein